MTPDPALLEGVTPHRMAKLPNILTVSRILSIPFLVWGILTKGWYFTSFQLEQTWLLLVLFAIICFTDFLDGFLARRWGVVSDFGRMLDPIADKLLVAACLIAICISMAGTYWFVIIPAFAIIGRDILVSGAREYAALKSRVMPPTKLAKWKTACEMLAVGLFILLAAWMPQILAADKISTNLQGNMMTLLYIASGLLWLAALLSVYTGSLYFRAALRD